MEMKDKRILLVEDSVTAAAFMKEILLKRGFQVVDIISTGKDAIETALRERPDLVLMDIILEDDVTGVEAARRILETFSVPIVFITATSVMTASGVIVGNAKQKINRALIITLENYLKNREISEPISVLAFVE